jgi:ABC-2 type transport system ATP-binding protein
VSHLSPSLVQRLGLAQSLIGSPRALLLDETLWGEGLLFEQEIVDLLTRLASRGVTIVISAPNSVELHRVVGRTVMMAEGRVVRPGPRDPAFAATAERAAITDGSGSKSAMKMRA